ncbi:hypothetical protein V6S65_09855 [Lactococcus lactis]|uniref:hypothetical protein n=1 Tax=Lactococcus lactis TaxID=1358 RepID=UPI000729D8C1|nr:hypothetical protein [Lactococcus lactis]KST98423.1 hypothetical protein KF201_2329 [Lactococcus lactis subsp. lactis]MBR8679406.1 hypothetical protein [Lactococcus lactis subsp. lactis]MBR8681766.1 hypothetical protein [Lactococcus lactis subsp. lactis]MBR8686890.1 hypothetical protein [Lactococcus lactis subsp. lactis]MCO0816931.1 hypothetical protein [Lactococcus lactis]
MENVKIKVEIEAEGLEELKNLSQKLTEQASEIVDTIHKINSVQLELKLNQ